MTSIASVFATNAQTITARDFGTSRPQSVNPAQPEGRSSVRPLQLLRGGALAGDVDGNGVVTRADLQKLVDYLLGKDVTDVVNPDVDGNGTPSLGDVTKLVNILTRATFTDNPPENGWDEGGANVKEQMSNDDTRKE